MVEMPKSFAPDSVDIMGRSQTFSGNRGLAIEEPLIFEIGSPETSGVDFEDPLTPALSPRGERTRETPSPPGERAGVRGSSTAHCSG